MFAKVCILILSGASFAVPTECAADPEADGTQYASLVATPRLKPPKPKRVIVVDRRKPSPLGRDMVTIPRGSFIMGSPRTEKKRDNNEGPQREVLINYKFEIGKHEITFNDWNECLRGGGCRGYKPNDAGWGKGNRPVINISWDDAQSYIRWLNKETGLNYRLPTEAEWEYVARGKENQPFSTGDSISSNQANFNGAFPYGPNGIKGQYRRKTMPVGSFAANAYGVHDIHGNVYEWVEDCWSPNHQGAPTDGNARLDGNCKFRVMRGGSWVTHGYQMRASKRLRYTTDYRYDDYGFRIARTLN